MRHRTTSYLMISLIVVSLALIFATLLNTSIARAQEEVPRVVNVSVVPTTAYKGYQSIEVTAYIYLPPGSSLRTASGTVTLTAGGVSQTILMTLVRLTAPITITVDNKSYSILNILIVRIPLSTGLAPGKGVLTVNVTGTAVMGGSTYDLSRTYIFTVTILDNTPVEMKRLEALLSLQRARTLFDVLQGLGVSVPTDLRRALDQAFSSMSRADDYLYSLGDVDRALATYDEVIRLSSDISTSSLSLISYFFANTSTSLQSILARLDTAENSIKALNTSIVSIADSVNTINRGLQDLAKTLQDYSASVSDSVVKINSNIDATNKKIDNVVSSMNSEINAKLKDLVDTINTNFNNISSTLSAIQLGLIVLGIAVLIVGALGFIRR